MGSGVIISAIIVVAFIVMAIYQKQQHNKSDFSGNIKNETHSTHNEENSETQKSICENHPACL